ncbi:hypothetical protein CcaverHIS002_0510230 [Cutaneotrichosporon cavernicola]|uniref:Protein kinase domain-containing protein n=1 Tax=Cutaneotrichosporon cavernicola TaxID=279322 RepID=A0AA48QXJ2_9TREE|nr:uncharacterized protein CcaverHIS019_0510790 [Cutaneotrichosporon cavernicola]BEI85622.1 hypothetical protein CcaverHIS002_0510230 [Cutaneotrichosporon cavernicola]BEI93451.1 hypothetical protein CcaverHIS019_0510790 [Cutaneotrichosporon cavernicola]BEJ01229.1 hypothetical protein CcaverHIS631_0510860 [Cutaneotrichosporon cavernicola]BEJ08998.1 hypothetical protein CcaverHIS641_0510920 [Cutaneotrichosporon cavernicola]
MGTTRRVTRQRDTDAMAHSVAADPQDKHRRTNTNRQSASGIYSMNDKELIALFRFGERIGYGNWGQVFEAVPSDTDSGIGADSAIRSGLASGGRVAIKMVERATNPAAAHCIRALWGEMKIIRGLRHEQHPSIIHFEAFLITPSYAAVVMPLHRSPMPLPLPFNTALRYFRQLASAVAYLHERGITHNDIKPANVVISYSDVPVLVDFGFAQHHKADDAKRFLSTASWGTPEYLDPLRVMGQPHDERKSDVWSLGVTMYEALVGRTPFEISEDEVFETQEELDEYLSRSRSGKWYGEYHIGDDHLERILQHMLYPDPAYRLPAVEIYTAISNIIEQYDKSSIATPSFARSDSFDLEFSVTERSAQRVERERAAEKDKHTERRLKTAQSEVLRRSALGDRKQMASASVLRPAKQLRSRSPDENVFVEAPPVPAPATKLRPRWRDELKRDDRKAPRVVSSEARPLRPNTAASAYKAATPSPPKKMQTRDEALAATLRSLQANSRQGSPVNTPSPRRERERERPSSAAADYARAYRERPRPVDSPHRVMDGSPRRVESMRERPASRLTRLADVAECEVLASSAYPLTPELNRGPTTPKIQISPSRTAPRLDVDIAPATFSPLRPTEPLVSKYRGPPATSSPNRKAKQSTAPSELAPAGNALHDLERLAEWAKRVELYVEQAKRAMAEGRPVPTMTLPDLEALAGAHATHSMIQAPVRRESLQQKTEVRVETRRLEPTREALEVPMSSLSSRSTASTTLQTPHATVTTLPQPKEKEHKSSLSKAASQTLKRHPVSQVFRRWGGDRGVLSPERPRIAVRKSEPHLDRRPIPSFQQQEVLETEGEPERFTPSRMGKPASSMSLREAVKAGLGMDRDKTIPRRFGTSPNAEGRKSKESTKKEEKNERRLSLFKLFKGKK